MRFLLKVLSERIPRTSTAGSFNFLAVKCAGLAI